MSDYAYYYGRVERELRMAERAATREARNAHDALASLYLAYLSPLATCAPSRSAGRGGFGLS